MRYFSTLIRCAVATEMLSICVDVARFSCEIQLMLLTFPITQKWHLNGLTSSNYITSKAPERNFGN